MPEGIEMMLTMPFSNVMHLPFAQKLAATRQAGIDTMSIQPQEALAIVAAEGCSLIDLRRMAEDAGVRIRRLDPLCTWVPDWHPVNMTEEFVRSHDVSATTFFEVAEALGCTEMSLNATFPAGRYTLEEVTGYYAEICRLADEHGLTCDLENIPMWGVRTLEESWAIVHGSGARNGGLVVDSLHFVRSGSQLSTLAAIPGEAIRCVQLSDGPLELDPGVSLEMNCFQRQWPGDGQFPLREMAQLLHRSGGLQQVCAEVFSADNLQLSASEVAVLSRTSLERILRHVSS
jgi:sugar phosphate isomerase/epimerase